MSNLQQRVKDAFDALEPPDGLKERTLTAIDRLSEETSAAHRTRDVSSGSAAHHVNEASDIPVASDAFSKENALTATNSPTFAVQASANSAGLRQESLSTSVAPRKGPLSTSAEPRQGSLSTLAGLRQESLSASAGLRQGSSSAHRPRRVRAWRAAFAVAACLALCAVGAFGIRLYTEPTAYVGIDVNPSLELALNRFDIVVEASAVNNDGERVLADVDLVGKAYGDALDELAQSTGFSRYATDNAYVQISITCSDAQQEGTLQSQSNSCLQGLGCQGSCVAVDKETHEAAHAAGMGVGRYQAALRLLELDPSMTLEACTELSMRELHDCIAQAEQDANAEGHHAAENESDAGGAGSAGHGEGKGHAASGSFAHRGAGEQ